MQAVALRSLAIALRSGLLCGALMVAAAGVARPADIQLPVPDLAAPISIDGQEAIHWQQGAVEVWVVRRCRVRQAQMTATGDEAVLWIDRTLAGSDDPSCVTVYLEGSAAVDFDRAGDPHPATGQSAQSMRSATWFGRFTTRASIHVQASLAADVQSAQPAIYERGQQAWDAAAHPVQLAQFAPQPPIMAEPLAPPPLAPVAGASKRVQVGPRSNALIHIKSYPASLPNQSVTVFSNGIRAVIEGVEAARFGPVGRIVIETDRLVLWAPNLKTLSSQGSETEGGPDVPIEVYMEGNIVFRQGDRLIYADRMYFNATHEYGVVLAAEVYTPVPEYEGMLRLKADVLHQLNRQFFRAYGAAITSSQMGVPRYWLQSQTVTFRDAQTPQVHPVTGQLIQDDRIGEPAVHHDMMATSVNNFLYIGGLPVLYWPVLATNLDKPAYYLDRFSFKSDNVFGRQFLADWDLFQLLRIEDPPTGTSWTLTTDYLSKRGMALGSTFGYQQASFLGHTGPVNGWLDAWGLKDRGLDNLGADRRALLPETDWRGRVYWRHLHNLPYGCQFTAQVGLISDRNFLEQYFEKEWDEWKDQVTSLQLKHTREDQSIRVLGSVRLNDFFTQTDWFPRLDHFLIGRSLFRDTFTWYAHTQAGYARQQITTAPADTGGSPWSYLPWESAATEGVRATTRHELDLPVQLGPFKIVPYGLGELGYWSELLDGEKEVTRAYGQAGMRVALPVWKSYPTVQNMLFNMNGLAHKTTFLTDVYWADANQNLDRFPLYDPIDDDSQEHFRRRFAAPSALYDERWFAFRSGVQGWVTAPTTEVVDDQAAARVGIHQRWQTKRGLPGQQRVVDFVTLDLDGTLFANPDRDDFGEVPGQLEYDFRWHAGDRLTFLSDGYADLFLGGLKAFSLGTAISRPERGQLYFGVVSMEGPFSSTLLVSSVSYRLSAKWIADLAASYDFGSTGQIGERVTVTHIGESALLRVGFYADHSRDNLGAIVSIEPRWLPNRRLGRVAGVKVPPPGTMGFD